MGVGFGFELDNHIFFCFGSVGIDLGVRIGICIGR